MARRRRPPQEFIRDITVADDGVRPVRHARLHSREKLGILVSYLSAYGRACRSAGEFSFVDALAGPGLYHFDESNDWLLGSTLIALRSEPRFARTLSMDLSADNVRALRARVDGDSKAVVVQGDCNKDLVAAMSANVRRDRPLFILLDPEGAELEWSLIEELSKFRSGPLKAELLVLFATEGVPRMLPVDRDIELHNEMRLNRLFPPTIRWRDIWQRRRSGELSPAEAREQYVAVYRAGLHELGYRAAEPRAITRPNGAAVYHLLFASDHPAGETIMRDVFENMNPNDPQMKLL